MKILSIITIVIALVVIMLLVYLSRHGLFSQIKIEEKNVGPYLLVYKEHIGDYKNTALVMDEIYYDLKDNYSIVTTKGFGIYYDNPKEVAKEKLRSIAGSIVEGSSLQDLGIISSKYTVKEYPASKSVVAEFPYTGKISIMLGVFKVYPKLNIYIDKKKYAPVPIMEIYDQPNGKIEYISPINLSEEVVTSLLRASEK